MFIMLFVKRSNNEHVAPFFLEKFRIARKAIFAPDAKRIGNAFFKEVLKERAHEIDRVERTRIQQQIEERRFTPPEGYTSFSWYQELKRRAAQGDTEAVAQLEKPFTNP